MPEFHAEPYIYLPALTHKSALVAWGAFYFRVTPTGRWKLIDDVDLKYVHPSGSSSLKRASTNRPPRAKHAPAPRSPSASVMTPERTKCVTSAKYPHAHATRTAKHSALTRCPT